MKTKLALVTSTLFVVVLGWVLIMEESSESEKLAVVNTFGKFQAYLLSSNFNAASDVLSFEFRNRKMVAEFQSGAYQMYLPYKDIGLSNVTAHVKVEKTNAELTLLRNNLSGMVLYFVKETDGWKLRDRITYIENY